MTSQTLAKLSHGAERFFWRLTLTADDFGRFEADPGVMLAKAFSAMLDQVTRRDIVKWFEEIVACRLVTTYDSGDKSLGFFNTWEKHQRKRARTSKYPAPSSDDIRQPPPSDSAEKREARSEKREARSETNTFVSFWSAYPKHKAKADALKAWTKLAPDPTLVALILAALDAQKQSPDWQKERGAYVPFPATWIRGRRWEDVVTPPIPGGLSQKTASNLDAMREFLGEETR